MREVCASPQTDLLGLSRKPIPGCPDVPGPAAGVDLDTMIPACPLYTSVGVRGVFEVFCNEAGHTFSQKTMNFKMFKLNLTLVDPAQGDRSPMQGPLDAFRSLLPLEASCGCSALSVPRQAIGILIFPSSPPAPHPHPISED